MARRVAAADRSADATRGQNHTHRRPVDWGHGRVSLLIVAQVSSRGGQKWLFSDCAVKFVATRKVFSGSFVWKIDSKEIVTAGQGKIAQPAESSARSTAAATH